MSAVSRAKKRSRLQIVMETLEALDEHSELHATELSLIVKLSYDRLRSILENLNERGLVEVERTEDERRSLMVKLTSEGRRLLEELRRLRKILEDYGLA